MSGVGRRNVLLGFVSLGFAPLVGCAAPAQAVISRPGRSSSPPPGRGPPEPAASPRVDVEVEPPAPPVETPAEWLLPLPPRRAGAEPGSVFLERTSDLRRAAFEDAIFEAIASGNVPLFQRSLLPIEVSATIEGRLRRAVLHVSSDYLAIGSDQDFLRMPMTAMTAQRVANITKCTLPTKHLVDEIFQQAELRLPPSFIEGGPTYTHRYDYSSHQRELEAHRMKSGQRLGVLTAGDKKDIVLSNRLITRESRVAIYGWHKETGEPIQPLSTVHGRKYSDYSHGVRLVCQRVLVDDCEQRIRDVLEDPVLSALLSDEGPLRVLAYPTDWPETEPEPPRRRHARR